MTENPSPLFEIARMLASFDHVASFIANANHSIMWTAENLRIPDCITDWASKSRHRSKRKPPSTKSRAIFCGCLRRALIWC